jgi:hypothetical protein
MTDDRLATAKAAVRRLTAEDRARLIVWIANGMPKGEEPTASEVAQTAKQDENSVRQKRWEEAEARKRENEQRVRDALARRIEPRPR